MPSKKDYVPLPAVAEVNDEEPVLIRSPAGSHRIALFLAFCAGIFIGIAVSFACFLVLQEAHQTPNALVGPAPPITHHINKDLDLGVERHPEKTRCGKNWQEAKRMGCHFDILASRWYSDDCYNDAVLHTMLKEVEFEWFEDPQHTKPVSNEVALSGEFDALWPLPDFHIMHCLYLWRRLHSAVVEHRYLDDDVYAYGHTVHCTKLIMQWPNEWKYGKNSTTIATSGRPYCRTAPL
jgi:hypothetical protein